MIHQHTMSQTKQAREDMFIGVTTSNINSSATASNYFEHTSKTSMAHTNVGVVVPSGPYTHIRIHPLLTGFTASAGLRITGWSKLNGTGTYYPTQLYSASITGVNASTLLINNSVNLRSVHGIQPFSYSPYTSIPTLNSIATAENGVGSLVVPVFGCSFVEVDFISATATAAYANILYSYCSIG